MELEQLRILLAAIETGSLAEASQALGLSRTTVRAHLDALEADVGVALLHRTHRGVEPTEDGSIFAERARALVRDANALRAFAAERDGEPAGTLRVCVAVGLPPELPVLFMTQLRRRYPGIAVHVDFSSDPVASLDVDTDVVLHFGPARPVGPFRTFVLARFPERLLASRAYLDAHGTPATLDELAGHALLFWRPAGETEVRWPLWSGGSFAINPVFASPDAHLVRTVAAAGEGIALVPDWPLAEGVPGEDLAPVLEGVVGREGALRVLVADASAGTARARVVLELLRGFAQGEELDAASAAQRRLAQGGRARRSEEDITGDLFSARTIRS